MSETSYIKPNSQPNKTYPRMTKSRQKTVAAYMNHVDGIVIDPDVKARTSTVKCKDCKQRYNEDDIDAGRFIPELSVCNPCLEKRPLT